MFSKLMIMTIGRSRNGGLRNPAPLLNARALEDVWLLADGDLGQGGRDRRRLSFYRRWRQAISSPIAGEEGIYNP